jgi:predicted glycoside hydrolase/deacetylase ChbG (UPF0249 family)
MSKLANTSLPALPNGDADTVTSVDVMFDCPGTEDALERIRKRPWLSIGWHNHCWGKPILGASRVPSLVRPDGHFKWTVADGTALVSDGVKQRAAVEHLENEINYEEVVAEFRAQMELCKKIVGGVRAREIQPDGGPAGERR